MKDSEKNNLIIDYVRGLCAPDDALKIEAVAKADPSVAADIAFTEKLRDVVRDDAQQHHQTDLDWARLSKAIDNEAHQHEIAANSNSPYWRYAAIFLGIVAIGQATFMALNNESPSQSGYVTASAEAEQHVLKIMFSENVTEIQIRDLFLQVNGEITAGPSALGLYEVSFPDADTKAEADITFSRAQNIIEIVE